MMTPFKLFPYFQQNAIQQRAAPSLPDTSLNLTSERKMRLLMTHYFLILKPLQLTKLLGN